MLRYLIAKKAILHNYFISRLCNRRHILSKECNDKYHILYITDSEVCVEGNDIWEKRQELIHQDDFGAEIYLLKLYDCELVNIFTFTVPKYILFIKKYFRIDMDLISLLHAKIKYTDFLDLRNKGKNYE